MTLWTDIGKGFTSHARAMEFISKHGLWAYFLYPAIIMILLVIAGFWSVLQLCNWIVNAGLDRVGLQEYHEGFLGWLATALAIVLSILFLLVVLSYLKYVVLIICSPILALLSEKIEEIMTGKKIPFRFDRFVYDMFRGMAVSLRNLVYESLVILLCTIAALIPGVGWFTVPFLFVVSWYFMGFAMMDYTYERQRLTIAEGARFTRRHKGIAIANGFVFSVLLMIPFAGMCIAPVLSVVAATLAVIEAKKDEPTQEIPKKTL